MDSVEYFPLDVPGKNVNIVQLRYFLVIFVYNHTILL